MTQVVDHAGFIDSWLREASQDRSPAERAQLSLQALNAIWLRASSTLGEVTMAAVFERVMLGGQAKYPWFVGVTASSDGVEITAVTGVDSVNLESGLSYLAVQLMTVLGSLTGDVLTSVLHDEVRSMVRAPAKRQLEPARKRLGWFAWLLGKKREG